MQKIIPLDLRISPALYNVGKLYTVTLMVSGAFTINETDNLICPGQNPIVEIQL